MSLCSCGYGTGCGVLCGDGSECHNGWFDLSQNTYVQRNTYVQQHINTVGADVWDMTLDQYAAFLKKEQYKKGLATDGIFGEMTKRSMRPTSTPRRKPVEWKVRPTMPDDDITAPKPFEGVGYWTARREFIRSNSGFGIDRAKLDAMLETVTDEYPDLDEVTSEPWSKKRIRKPKNRSFIARADGGKQTALIISVVFLIVYAVGAVFMPVLLSVVAVFLFLTFWVLRQMKKHGR